MINVNMLRAVRKMLVMPMDSKPEIIMTRLHCAIDLLDEIIMENTPPMRAVPVNEGPVYDVKVHPETKKLEYIMENGVPLDDDTPVMLDNKQMKYSYAIGQTFNTIKVV